jgi:RND family efflux transporter MFP subunit
MAKKLVLAVLFLGGLVLILVWMQGGFHRKIAPGRISGGDAASVAVNVFKVEPVRAVEEVTVSGSVVSRETAAISARAQGYVTAVEVDSGDAVTQGRVLIKVDLKEAAEREAQARAALESASADLTKAEKDFERYKALFEKASIARKEFDDATARYEMAKAALSRAKAALDEASTMVSYGTITAPFDGVIGERKVNLGDLVSPGKVLMTVYDPAKLELVASVGEQYAEFLKVDEPVKVKIDSIKLEAGARIREIVPQRDEKTRTLTVKVPLEKNPGLVPGLYGSMAFKTLASETVMIPAQALNVVGQLETVKVKENGAIKVRNVKAGRTVEGKVEILSGLKSGDLVILDEKKR